MLNIIAVAIGGSIGAVTRYLFSLWAANRFGAGFPYGTLFVNIIGCFIIGCFMTLVTERVIVNPYWRLLVTVGFVGGLTTFSSYSYETIKLLDSGLYVACLNLFGNLVLGFMATFAGIFAAKLI